MKYHFSEAFCCIYAVYNYIRQPYDTLTRSSVMQCNTTKVIRAFKCNMMAKIHLRSDLCFISDANHHNSQRVKSFWFCSREQLYQRQRDVPVPARTRRPIDPGRKHVNEFVALGSAHPLNWNPKSYRSAAIHTGLKTGTFKISTKTYSISEFYLARQEFAPLAILCPHRGRGEYPHWLLQGTQSAFPDLLMLKKLIREDFIQISITSNTG